MANEEQFSKEDLVQALEAIETTLETSKTASLHSMLFLNKILRSPNAREILDANLTTRTQTLWNKVKATGLQLNDPPILS